MATKADVIKSMVIAQTWGATVQDVSVLIDGLRAFMDWDDWTYILREGGEVKAGQRAFYTDGRAANHVSCLIKLGVSGDEFPFTIKKVIEIHVPHDKGTYKRGEQLEVTFSKEAQLSVNVLDPESVLAFYRAASGIIQTIFTDAVAAAR